MKKVMMVWSEILMVLMAIMCSGCLGEVAPEVVECNEEVSAEYYWMDSHQWNGAPMSYANLTVFTLNNNSTPTLNLTIDVVAYFSEGDGILEQGWVNISIKQNGTLWENETSHNKYWELSLPINTTEDLTIDIRAAGKDSHPNSVMGDYFISEIHGVMKSPLLCE